jgi:valyl-tRNA synthetase
VRVLETTLRLAHPLIPFITEELWQKVAPLAGRQGDSIMLQPYPVPDPAKIDGAALADMGLLKELVNACRALRGEMNVGPGERVPLLVAGAPAERQRVEALAAWLKSLARLAGIEIVTGDLPDEGAPVSVIGGLQLMLRIEIDIAEELERLARQAERLRGDIARAEAKLANAGFVARAPEAVVAQERERLASFSATLADIESQRARLAARAPKAAPT